MAISATRSKQIKINRTGRKSRGALAVFAALAVVLFTLSVPFRSYAAEETLPSRDLISFVVYEQDTHQLIASRNQSVRADVTLLARMMTAIVALEASVGGRTVSVTDAAAPTESSQSSDGKFRLYAGQEYTLDVLLKAALLGGADNCVREIARFINPNTEYFVSLMNQTAARLGMSDTYFTAPDGPTGELDRTTVRDIMLFYDYALNHSQFRKIVQSEFSHIWDYTAVFNKNSLIFSLAGSFTAPAAGGLFWGDDLGSYGTAVQHITLPALLPEDSPMKLVAVFNLAKGSDTAAAYGTVSDGVRSLLEDVYSNYHKTVLYNVGDEMTAYSVSGQRLSVLSATLISCVVPSDTAPANFVQSVSYTFYDASGETGVEIKTLEPPLFEGSSLGTASILLLDGSVHQAYITAGNTIQTPSQAVNRFLNLVDTYRPLFIIIAILLVIELYVTITVTVNFIAKKVRAHRRNKE